MVLLVCVLDAGDRVTVARLRESFCLIYTFHSQLYKLLMSLSKLFHVASVLAVLTCLNVVVGCGGAPENTVVTPEQSPEQLRAETEAKIEKAQNVDPATL
jgi:hypothetical protein